MEAPDIAAAVLASLGGRANVLTNTVCMTRLRVTLSDPEAVEYESLNEVQGVLGTAVRGNNGLEVVFGPRMIDGIYHSFISLTGIPAGTDALFPMSRQDSNMRVHISSAGSRTGAFRTSSESSPAASRPSYTPATSSPMGQREISILEDLFGRLEEDESDARQEPPRKLLVINGPNINMLGMSEECDEVDYPSLLEICKQVAADAGFSRCDCLQSNHEGDLVDAIQDAYQVYSGIIINPTTYGASKTLRDTLRGVGIPAVEVHLHKVSRCDTVGTACQAVVSGKGANGYRIAIQTLSDMARG